MRTEQQDFLLSKFKCKLPENINILVVGDFMLDRYVVGTVDRISPEAPVPILNLSDQYNSLGGAGNVVNNLATLNANVLCYGVIGKDEFGRTIENKLEKLKISYTMFRDIWRRTTVKTRYVTKDSHVQLLRTDIENTNEYDVDLDEIIIPKNIDIIIVSDYNKGFITSKLMQHLKDTNIKIIVDPKPQNQSLYHNVFMTTPNLKEYNSMKYINSEYILKTLGKNGLDIIHTKTNDFKHIDAKEVKVFNVSGCGDTIVAVMALCLSMKMAIFDAAYIANECAGIVASKPGTAFVTLDEFYKVVTEYYLEQKCAK